MNGYAQGTPCLAELQTSDPLGAQRFYAGLFGWIFTEVRPDPEFGYSTAQLGGREVCAIAGQPADDGSAAMWNVYLAVQDVATCVSDVIAAGGTVYAEPFELEGAGVMAIAADPTGAVCALYQARGWPGAELSGEPGRVCWNELVTDDPTAALEFFARVLGLHAVNSDGEPVGAARDADTGIDADAGLEYALLVADGQAVGGCVRAQDGVPNHWNVWFAAADVDALAARAAELGGSVLVTPVDMPAGRMCVLADPQGGVFNVLGSAGSGRE